jgi:hypothetical protein
MPEVSRNTWPGSITNAGVAVGSGGSADAGRLSTAANSTAPKTREILNIVNQVLAMLRWFFISLLLCYQIVTSRLQTSNRDTPGSKGVGGLQTQKTNALPRCSP